MGKDKFLINLHQMLKIISLESPHLFDQLLSKNHRFSIKFLLVKEFRSIINLPLIINLLYKIAKITNNNNNNKNQELIILLRIHPQKIK